MRSRKPTTETGRYVPKYFPPEESTPAHFFARLASIPDFNALPVEAFGTVAFDLLGSLLPDKTLPLTLALMEHPVIDATRRLLPRLHAETRRVLCGLVDNEMVEPAIRIAMREQWRVDDEGNLWRTPRDGTHLEDFCFSSLLAVLVERPFPFARCGYCRSIYVRGTDKRRAYCSPGCAHQHAEDARREAKKAYMRERRARAKKAKRSPSSQLLKRGRTDARSRKDG